MAKVYVFASKLPTGGAYMAYHIGRLLHLHFGYEYVDVAIREEADEIFDYDIEGKSVDIRTMESRITKDDLLIANPSYSRLLLGLRLPGRKIMYVQDFKTFKLLDCQFDMYVSVSSLVQRYLKAVYGMDTPVIPAFIDLDTMPGTLPWEKRRAGSAVVYSKHSDVEHDMLLDFLQKMITRKAPNIDLSHVIEGRGLPHTQFLKAVGNVQYLVNLSLSEGFGLVPLEAMAVGTMVTGLDSLGGAEYMRHEENCIIAPSRNLKLLPAVVHKAFTDTKLASACAAGGIVTAQRYGYEPFRQAWLARLSAFLKTQPHGA